MAYFDFKALKVCSLCKEAKHNDQFSIHRQKKDGLSGWCKTCSVKKVQAYTASDEARAKKKLYDAKRVARLKEGLQAQYKANYLKTRQQKISSAAEWAANNPEKRKAISQSYKYRRRSQESSGVGYNELIVWKAAQQKVCYWCATTCAVGYVIDHYQPLSKGGKHELSNLVISCRKCNASKSAKDPYDFAQAVGRLF